MKYDCNCPYCSNHHSLNVNKTEYTLILCKNDKCGKIFWILPRIKENPYRYTDDPDLFHRLRKEDLDAMMDLALGLRDYEWCSEIHRMMGELNSEGYIVKDIYDEDNWDDEIFEEMEEDDWY